MIIRVFPRRTKYTPRDRLAFVGDPPLFRPPASNMTEIHISVTFTWDMTEGQRLKEAWQAVYPDKPVLIGGPAFGSNGAFVPGRYISKGVTFTTRGCNNHCLWCLVRQREGCFVELENFAPGHIIQDNNLLQAGKEHLARVGQMLNAQSRAARFSGGLDARLIDNWVADWLRGLRISALFLAADTDAALPTLEQAIRRLSFLPRDKLFVYALIAYNGESINDATARLETIWELGGMPFAQLYQPADRYIQYSREWTTLAREWSRPAIIKSKHAPPQINRTKPQQLTF